LSEVWFFNFLRLRHCSMDQTAVFSEWVVYRLPFLALLFGVYQ
jgi:hypothetical protein